MPLRVGPKTPKPDRKKAEKYLLVACTKLYTHYLLGDRDLDTFKTFVLAELSGSVVVQDRYQFYDKPGLGELTHQPCTQHLLRDVDDAGEIYPDAAWPPQIACAKREGIELQHLARSLSPTPWDPELSTAMDHAGMALEEEVVFDVLLDELGT